MPVRDDRSKAVNQRTGDFPSVVSALDNVTLITVLLADTSSKVYSFFLCFCAYVLLFFLCFDFLLSAEENGVTFEPVGISNEDGQPQESMTIMPPILSLAEENDETSSIDR